MSERKIAEEIDAEISELISRKIAAEDADSGWVLAYAAMRVLPVLKEIAEHLHTMQWVLGEDWEDSPQIANVLRRIASLLEEGRIKERLEANRIENEEWKRRR
jgi:hypothetical protein